MVTLKILSLGTRSKRSREPTFRRSAVDKGGLCLDFLPEKMKKKRQFNLIRAFLLVNFNFCCSTWAADSEESVDWGEEKNLLSGKHLHVLLSLVQVYLHIFILLYF